MTRNSAIGAGCASIWIGIFLISLLSPDMVSGSEHEHLPLAAITTWIWGLAATGYLVMLGFVANRTADASLWRALAAGVGGIWLIAAGASILGPELVTGSDPTRIPLAALITPPAAALATCCACIIAGVLRSKDRALAAGTTTGVAGMVSNHG